MRSIGATATAFQAWAHSAESGYKRSTKSNVTQAVNELLGRPYLPARPLAKLDVKVLYLLQQNMARRSLARATVDGRVKWIKAMVRWAAQAPRFWTTPEHYRSLHDLVPKLKPHRSAATETSPVAACSASLFAAVIGSLDGSEPGVTPPWVSAVAWSQRLTATRPREVCTLRWSWVDRDGPALAGTRLWVARVPLDAHKMGWKNRERVFLIGPQAQNLLDRWRARTRKIDDVVFPGRRIGQSITVSGYRRKMTDCCDGAGMDRVTPRQIRKLGAQDFADAGGISAAKEQLGHGDEATTMVYARLTAQSMPAAAKAVAMVG